MEEQYTGFAKSQLKAQYGIDGSIKRLPGYDDLNFRVDADEGRFVLKINTTVSDAEFLQAEGRVLSHLNRPGSRMEGVVQHPIPMLDGSLVKSIEMPDGSPAKLRMLSFLPGKFVGEIPRDEKLFRSLGRTLGQLNHELTALSESVISARVMKWDLQHLMLNAPLTQNVQDRSLRRLIEYFLMGFKNEVLPELPFLSRQLIQNDANEWNVLTSEGVVSGLIDFSDMVCGPRIQELAVSMAYSLMGEDDPIQAGVWMIEGYVEHCSLEPREIPLLYWMLAGRLCTTLLSSAQARANGTATDYILISEKGAWTLLEKWLTINPCRATRAWQQAAFGKQEESESESEDLLASRHRLFSTSMSISYAQAIHMDRAGLQYMYGADGRSYLDCVNNIMHVGHCHPKVVAAIQRQAARLNTNTRYLYNLLNDLAERVLAHFPAKMNRVFFVNSGSAAGDLAMRITRSSTGRQNMGVMKYGYHGNTASTIAVSHYKYAGKGGMGRPATTFEAPLGGDAKKAFPEGLEMAGLIHESIVGCGGQVVLDGAYMRGLYAEVRKRGGLCIADEVQTGFGRVGKKFWAYELLGLDPDIVVLGKPMGNGHPLAAVVTSAEVVEGFETGMEFFSSFGGNPVSCAAGLAVLEVIEEEGLQAHAKELGEWMVGEWNRWKNDFSEVADVRGSGLFLGLELVDGGGENKPNGKLAKAVVNQMKQEGFLLSTDGPAGNVIKFKPPMCFDKGNAEELSHHLRKALHRNT